MATHVAALRKQRGITQKELAVQMGYSETHKNTIGNIEQGNMANPGIRKKIAEFFGKKEEEIFDKQGFALEEDE